MATLPEPTISCIECRSVFTNEQIKGVSACPNCGTKSIPLTSEDDVRVNINWHELRILVIWAENYANSIKGRADVEGNPVQTIFGIAKRLQDQHPLFPSLTLSAEFELVKKAFPGATIHGPVTPGGPISGGDDEIG